MIDPKISEHGGRLVGTAGDSLLIEFASVVEAVQYAVEAQQGMQERNATTTEDTRLQFRIGVNLGDIIIDGDDIFGDGVNIAARLEALAAPGGVCVSDAVYQNVKGKLTLAFEDLGPQHVKNITKPVRAWQWRSDAGDPAVGDAAPIQQDIHFCLAADGVQIAYATAGSGPPLVKAPNWMNHLEHDWQSPIWRHLLLDLAADHTLLRFDQRGNGLSDWDVEDISFDAFVGDLESVVDAAGLERFPLLGISQGCSFSIAYAARHPERVSHLILYGGYARGRQRRGSAREAERAEAMQALIRLGWGQDNPAFRQMFTSSFMPGATLEQMEWFNELQRISTSPENAARIHSVNDVTDVTSQMAEISAPTLVLHCRDDGIVPFNEGRLIAATIPNARFVPLEGRNHLILEEEPAWSHFLEEVRGFLKTPSPAG